MNEEKQPEATFWFKSYYLVLIAITVFLAVSYSFIHSMVNDWNEMRGVSGLLPVPVLAMKDYYLVFAIPALAVLSFICSFKINYLRSPSYLAILSLLIIISITGYVWILSLFTGYLLSISS